MKVYCNKKERLITDEVIAYKVETRSKCDLWLEELKEKRAEEKQQEKKDLTVKRTTIQANSEEELIEKISELDWSKIAEEKATQGMKFDTTI